MPLQAEDLDDARDALRVAGRDAGTFTFKYVAYPRMGCAVGPPLADVIVTDTHSGLVRVYPVSNATAWTSAFRDDVARGIYRSPMAGAPKS